MSILILHRKYLESKFSVIAHTDVIVTAGVIIMHEEYLGLYIRCMHGTVAESTF